MYGRGCRCCGLANLEDASKPGHSLVIMMHRGSTLSARNLFWGAAPKLRVGCSPNPDLSCAAATPSTVEVTAFPYANDLLKKEPFKSNPAALARNDKRFLALDFPDKQLVFVTAYLPSLPLEKSLHPPASEDEQCRAMGMLLEREEAVQVRGSPVGRCALDCMPCAAVPPHVVVVYNLHTTGIHLGCHKYLQGSHQCNCS